MKFAFLSAASDQQSLRRLVLTALQKANLLVSLRSQVYGGNLPLDGPMAGHQLQPPGIRDTVRLRAIPDLFCSRPGCECLVTPPARIGIVE